MNFWYLSLYWSWMYVSLCVYWQQPTTMTKKDNWLQNMRSSTPYNEYRWSATICNNWWKQPKHLMITLVMVHYRNSSLVLITALSIIVLLLLWSCLLLLLLVVVSRCQPLSVHIHYITYSWSVETRISKIQDLSKVLLRTANISRHSNKHHSWSVDLHLINCPDQ